MPKADITPTTSRRRLLTASCIGAARAGGVAVHVAPSTKEPHPDDAVLAACIAFMEAHDRYRVIDRPNNSVSDDEQDQLHDAWHEALDAVTKTRAKTPKGMRAKARATIAAFEMDVNRAIADTIEDVAEPHVLLAWRLAHDILLGYPA